MADEMLTKRGVEIALTFALAYIIIYASAEMR